MQEHRKHRVYRRQGDNHWKPVLLFVLLGVSVAGLMVTIIYKKKHGKTEKAKKEE